MASKGKKGKKKGQTLNLTEFLGGDGGAYRAPGAGATTTVAVSSTWADEMDEVDMDDKPRQQVVLPTAPRAALGPDIDDDRIPTSPPFTAYIANLPYETDEMQVKEVFMKQRLKVVSVRLMKDEGGRPKGYGYADFEDRESLLGVLTMTELNINGRKMRIDLASGAGKDNDRGGFRDRNGPNDRPGRRDDDPDAGRSDASNDWRSGPPPPARESDRDRDRGGGFRDRNGDDRGGGSRGFGNYEPPRDRGGFDRGYGARDRYNDRGDDRGGRGYGFSRDGGDRYGGDRDRYGGDRDRRRSPEAPKERPKLSLAPRSKPKEESEDGGAAQAAIFGGAKPVDTLKKEKEIEEKLAREKEEKARKEEEMRRNKPTAASIFGAAKPVDTTQREREIEQKISKLEVREEKGEEKSGGGEPATSSSSGAYRPPASRDSYREDRRDDRRGGGGYDRDRDRGDRDRGDRDRGDRDRGGYRRDDRGYDRDRERRDDYRGDDRGGYDRRGGGGGGGGGYDRKDEKGYSRRDDRGGYDRGGYDRRDDRSYSSRDDHRDRRGGDYRRDDHGYDRDRYDGNDRRDDYRDGGRRDDRDGGRRDDRDGGRRDERDGGRRDERDGGGRRVSEEKEVGRSREKSPPPMKKYEEPKPPTLVAPNKFAYLQDEDGDGGSGSDE